MYTNQNGHPVPQTCIKVLNGHPLYPNVHQSIERRPSNFTKTCIKLPKGHPLLKACIKVRISHPLLKACIKLTKGHLVLKRCTKVQGQGVTIPHQGTFINLKNDHSAV